jgi:hypothetical protein
LAFGQCKPDRNLTQSAGPPKFSQCSKISRRPAGKTPAGTLHAAIAREIKLKKE